MSRRSSFREGLGYGVLSFGSIAFLGVFTSVANARVYGIDVIGEYALTFAPVWIMTYLSSSQEQVALVRRLALLRPRDPQVTGLFTAVLAFSVALTVLVAIPVTAITWLLLVGPVDAPELVAPTLAMLAGYALITNTCWNLDMVFSSFRAGRALFWIRLVQALVFFIVSMAIGLVDPTVWGLVVATIASWALGLLHRGLLVRAFMLFRVAVEEVRKGFRVLPELIRFGLRLAPGSIAQGAAGTASPWLLGIMGGIADVGAWNRAAMLAGRLAEAATRLNEVLYPTLVERRDAGDGDGHDRALIDSMRYGMAGMLLIAAAGGGAAVGVMNVFGPGFDAAAVALAIVLVGQAFATSSGPLGMCLVAAGRPGAATWANITQTVLQLGLAVALIKPLGVTGAGLALTGSLAITMLVTLLLVRRSLFGPFRAWWPLRNILPFLLAYVAGFAAARVVDDALGGLLGTLAALSAGCVAYLGAFWLLGGLLGRDRARLAHAVARLRGGRSPADAAGPPGGTTPQAGRLDGGQAEV